ncbi:MAG TPA: methyltransferase domain-containing protein, partial [Saprospiraceae bacterium]|nr:methyltransferase domain-containing protein [Saprospiraceae bacterium]
MKQEKAFLDAEGDAWFNRNFLKLENPSDPVVKLIDEIHEDSPGIVDVLEFGCANGWRLNILRNLGLRCHGIDPSMAAIENGNIRFPGMDLKVGTMRTEDAAPTGHVDFLIYGFCLYLAEPAHLPEIVYRGDRSLSDGGFLIIHDFDPDYPHMVTYHHQIGLFSYKMDYSKLWLANPA